MPAFIAAILAFLAKWATADFVIYVANRILVITALFIVLPLVLYNVQMKIMGEIISFVVDRLNNLSPVPWEKLEIAGVVGWMALKLRIPTCINILLTAVQVRFAIAFWANR